MGVGVRRRGMGEDVSRGGEVPSSVDVSVDVSRGDVEGGETEMLGGALDGWVSLGEEIGVEGVRG
jgi:hypothetical protein